MSHLAFEGLLLGFCTFLTIGIFHPIVVKAEYYFGLRPWAVFLLCGVAGVAGAPFIASVFWSALSAIVGFSCLWSILELFEQRQRVIKGWFPMNPAAATNTPPMRCPTVAIRPRLPPSTTNRFPPTSNCPARNASRGSLPFSFCPCLQVTVPTLFDARRVTCRAHEGTFSSSISAHEL